MAEPGQMNVLLVTVDCFRQDRCGIYNHHRNTTPTLDSIAKQAYIFDNAYSTGPTTTESFAGILAGRLSKHTAPGDRLYQKTIPKEGGTIASHLREHGWSTGATISNPRVDSERNVDLGFDRFTNLRETNASSQSGEESDSRTLLPELKIGSQLYQIRENMRASDSIKLRYLLPLILYRTYQYSSGWPSIRSKTVVTESLDMLDELSPPFFGWTHLMDLHGPIHPQVVQSSQLYSASTLAQFYSQAHTVGNIYYPAKDAYYDSALRHIDDQLCRIKKWLKNENEWDNTILIITADHGEALADRGIYGHPLHYMYDELVSVPLVVRVPGQRGGRVKGLFSLGWLSELIADAVGIDRPEFPCQSSRETHLNPPAEMDEEVLYADTISTEGHTVMMRQEDIKLVLHNDNFSIGSHDKITPENRVTPEAQFELAVDPHERDPLDLKHSLVETGRQFVSDPDEWFDRNTNATIDKETLDQLQQLGYSE